VILLFKFIREQPWALVAALSAVTLLLKESVTVNRIVIKVALSTLILG